MSLPLRRTRQRSCNSPLRTASPIPVRPKTIGSIRTRRASSAEVDLDVPVQHCLVEQDRLLRQPRERGARRNAELDVDDDRRAEAAIDLFGRRAGDHQSRILADRHVDIEGVAAGHAAAGVDRERLLARRTAAPGKRTRSEPLSCTRCRLVMPEKPSTPRQMRPRARMAVRSRSAMAVIDCITPRPGDHQVSSYRA